MFKHDLTDGANMQILELRHAQAFVNFVRENREHLLEWLDWSHLDNLEAAQNFIRRGLTRYTEDGLPWVGIWQREQLVGGVLFFPIDQRSRSSEIGYWLGRDFSGRGLVTRAAKAMLGFAFEQIGLNRVALRAQVENQRSRAVATRLGFQFEGVEREAMQRGGQFYDLALYSMLAKEWKKPELI